MAGWVVDTPEVERWKAREAYYRVRRSDGYEECDRRMIDHAERRVAQAQIGMAMATRYHPPMMAHGPVVSLQEALRRMNEHTRRQMAAVVDEMMHRAWGFSESEPRGA